VARDAATGIRAQKKRPRPSEVDRPDVQAKRAAFLRWVRRADPTRLVFIDESGANIAMGRSHAWVRRGEEYVARRPMNWGTNLTLIGAIRHDRWLTLSTRWRAVTKHTFTAWVRQRLAPRLRPGDVVLLDNLRAHTDPAVRVLIERRGAQLRFLPPYSYDFNPIEAAWALVKKRIRAFRPRTAHALRRVARAARHVIRAHHFRQWFAHAGYVNSSTFRG
jgi:transposase